MADLPCRFDAHIALVSWLSGIPYETPACPEPARHTEIFAFEPASGLTVHVDTDVCDEHEAKLACSTFHKRSIKLRQYAT